MEILNFNQFNEGLKVKLRGSKGVGHEIVFSKRTKSGSVKDVIYDDPIIKKGNVKKVVKKVVKQLGYDEGKVIYKGSGSFGSAFTIDGKAIKFTSDSSEAALAMKMVKITEKNCPDYIIKYYGVYKLKSKKLNDDIYVIIMDEVELPNYNNGDDSPDFFFEICRYVESEDGYTPDESDFESLHREYGYNVKDIEKWYNDLMNGKKYLNSKGIKSGDYHDGNIGFKKGHLVHFDMRNLGVEQRTLKKLEDILA